VEITDGKGGWRQEGMEGIGKKIHRKGRGEEEGKRG
jgi:hypothetical protein